MSKTNAKIIAINAFTYTACAAIVCATIWGMVRTFHWMNHALPRLMDAHPVATEIFIGVLAAAAIIAKAVESYSEPVSAEARMRCLKVAAEGGMYLLGMTLVSLGLLTAAGLIGTIVELVMGHSVYGFLFVLITGCLFALIWFSARGLLRWHRRTFPESTFVARANPFNFRNYDGPRRSRNSS